jgi:hypothetical protein
MTTSVEEEVGEAAGDAEEAAAGVGTRVACLVPDVKHLTGAPRGSSGVTMGLSRSTLRVGADVKEDMGDAGEVVAGFMEYVGMLLISISSSF